MSTKRRKLRYMHKKIGFFAICHDVFANLKIKLKSNQINKFFEIIEYKVGLICKKEMQRQKGMVFDGYIITKFILIFNPLRLFFDD